jgi:Arc/MetJ-type ribon-helix-helix transcriptional regulator
MELSSLPLPPDLANFVTDQVRTGAYASEGDLVCEALRLLRSRHASQEVDADIRRKLEVGYQQIDRGEGIEVDEASLAIFFASIRAEAASELADDSAAAS